MELTSDALRAKILEDAPLELIFKDDRQLFNPLEDITEEAMESPDKYIAWLMSRPEYFGFTCEHLMNIKLHPMQACVLEQLWTHNQPMLVGSRGFGKSFLLGVYSLLRILILRKRKVLICGSGFRQSKIIFQYMEQVISGSKILKNMITEDNITHGNDMYVMNFGDSSARAIPVGTGDKIRGLRANDVIADEFASIPVDIFETVIAGFASVASSPTEQAAKVAQRKAMKIFKIGFEDDSELDRKNQIVISGTAFYSFNHFAQYHEKHKKIIKSRGNPDRLAEISGEKLDWKQYCIIRVPVDIVPEGFMDADQIARAKATVHSGIYEMEYGSVFSSDSNGFYKRSLIESCVVKENTEVRQTNGNIISAYNAFFEPKLNGDKGKEYVIGVDPAMTQDNFSIVIIELNGDHRKVVYCWTTNKDDHKNKLKANLITENNYYAYCARKIRNLMDRFNTAFIAIDAQGGGRAVLESINDDHVRRPGEIKLWPIINNDKQEDTDMFEGLHIIDLVQFTREDWTGQANHGLKKDMEDRVLLFPHFDAISFAEAEFKNDSYNDDDRFEKIIEEIEELKNELSTITVTQTPATNRERWDTPEFKLPNGKKGRMRKDRYSSLLMANMTARVMERTISITHSTSMGGVATTRKNESEEKKISYSGNPVISSKFNTLYRS